MDWNKQAPLTFVMGYVKLAGARLTNHGIADAVKEITYTLRDSVIVQAKGERFAVRHVSFDDDEISKHAFSIYPGRDDSDGMPTQQVYLSCNLIADGGIYMVRSSNKFAIPTYKGSRYQAIYVVRTVDHLQMGTFHPLYEITEEGVRL